MSRLTTAVAVAGTICALGASVAIAAPRAGWAPPNPPVPGAFTNDSAAISSVTFPNPIGQGTMVAWRGQGALGHIFYKYRTAALHHWSHLASIPGALTSSPPAIASYTDPFGKTSVLAVWAGHVNNEIWYSQGHTRMNGTISWTAPVFIPNTVAYNKTFSGPTVFFLGHSGLVSNVMVLWRGPGNHVRYSIGTPAGRGFNWSQSTVIPGNPPSPNAAHCTVAPCTSATPTVAEVTTGTTTGSLYIFWKQLGTKDIFYSSATDSASTNWAHPGWTLPAQVPNAVTLTAPAVSVPRVAALGALLLVYKAPYSTHVRFQTLQAGTWSAVARVPGTLTAVAPVLNRNLLGTTTPSSIGNIILRVYIP
jgi:hypothetical protein